MMRFLPVILLGTLAIKPALAVNTEDDPLHTFLNTKPVWPIWRSEMAIASLPEDHPVRIKTLRSVAKNKSGMAFPEVILRAALALPEGDQVRTRILQGIEQEKRQEEWRKQHRLLRRDAVRSHFMDRANPFG